MMNFERREELDLAVDTDDIDQRLKYAGIFHRRKRTPGRFMMRCVPGLPVDMQVIVCTFTYTRSLY